MSNNLKCDVVVTCGRFAYQIMASLAKAGYSVWLADYSDVPAFHSVYSSGHIIVPNYEEDEVSYIRVLSEKLTYLSPKVLIPLFDFSTIAKYRESLPLGIRVPIGSLDALSLLDNKKSFLKYASKLGIPMPTMYDRCEDCESFPAVFKLVHGRSSEGVYIARDMETFRALYEAHKDEEFVMTAFAQGCDYSIDCLRFGDFFCGSVYKVVRESSSNTNRPSICREIVENNMIEHYSRVILDSLGFNGVCGFDFRVNEDTGEVFLLEANPRYTGGSGTQIAAGFDIPVLQYKLSLGEVVESPEIKIGTRTKSFMRCLGTAYRNIVEGSSKYRISQDLHRPLSQYEDFNREDLKPFLLEILRHKRRVVTIIIYALFRIRVNL